MAHKFNLLDRESQRFDTGLGAWTPLTGTIAQRVGWVGDPNAASIVESLYAPYQPTSLKLTPQSSVLMIGATCGVAGTFPIDAGRVYRATTTVYIDPFSPCRVTLQIRFFQGSSELVANAASSTLILRDSARGLASLSFHSPSGFSTNLSATMTIKLERIDGNALAENATLFVDRPVIAESTETLARNPMLQLASDWIPGFIKDADRAQSNPDLPLMRYFHGATAIAGQVIDTVRDFHYVARSDGGPVGDSCSLLDPILAEDAWLNWLGQLQGIYIYPLLQTGYTSWKSLEGSSVSPRTWLDWQTLFTTWAILQSYDPEFLDPITVFRQQIIDSDGGINVGSYAGVRTAVKRALTGTLSVNVENHHDDDPWTVLIETLPQETPSVEEVLNVANQVRPAGVRFTHGDLDRLTVAGISQSGQTVNHLNSPFSLTLDADGRLFIADRDNDRVIRWPSWGTDVATLRAGTLIAGGLGQGTLAQYLDYPRGVAVDANGVVYVSDMGNHRVQKWTPGSAAGVTVAGVGGSGSATNQLRLPWGIAIDSLNNIFVVDSDNHRVMRWAENATDGVLVAGGNGQGSGASQLSLPSGIALDGSGNIYVADAGNHRVVKWASNGTVVGVVAGGNGLGDDLNQLNSPTGLALDGDGNLFIADMNNDRVMRWDVDADEGVLVAGGNGRGWKSRQLNAPTDVAVDATGDVYVADSGNHRIQKWLIS